MKFFKIINNFFFIFLFTFLLNQSLFAQTIHFTNYLKNPTSCDIAGRVSIDDIQAVDNEDEIGVFVTNESGNEILIGAGIIGAEISGLYYVTAYGDDFTTIEKDGAIQDDILIFKIWDKSENIEYNVITNFMSYEAYNGVAQPEIPFKWTDGNTFALLNFNVQTNINNMPFISKIDDITINEDSEFKDIFFTAYDIDSDIINISVKSDNNNLIPKENLLVQSAENSYTLSIKPDQNQYGTTKIFVSATDNRLTNTTSFIVNVSPVNDLPEFSEIYDKVTNEDNIFGPFAFSIIDADGDNITITSTSDNNDLVLNNNINIEKKSDQYEITIIPNSDKNGIANITIYAADGLSTSKKEFKLFVTEVNDQPELMEIEDITTDEDFSMDNIEIFVNDIDSDNIELLSSSDNQNLIPDSSISIIKQDQRFFLNLKPLANQNGKAIITITANDGYLIDQKEFTLNVMAVNDAPEISSIQDIYIIEDHSSDFIDFTVSDIDEDQILVSTSSDNQLLIPEKNIIIEKAQNYKIKITPLLNQHGKANITVFASDNQITSTTDIQVIVIPVNDPPEIAKISDKTIFEDSFIDDILISASDIDSNEIFILAYSDNPALVTQDSISITDADNNNKILKITPLGNKYGNTTIFISASDKTLTTTTSFNLIIKEVNDSPEISKISDIQIKEDETKRSIYFDVIDIDSSQINISAVSDNPDLILNNRIIISGNLPHKELTISPNPDKYGHANIQIMASDGKSITSTEFLLTVTPVNDFPIISKINDITINEDTAYNNINFSYYDPDFDLINISAESDNPALLPDESITINLSDNNGYINVKPASDKSGSALITISASDSILVTSTSFYLNVIEQNDPPEISQIQDIQVYEDNMIEPVYFNVYDIDSTVLFVKATADNRILLNDDSLVINGESYTRTLYITPIENATGEANILISVSDGSLTKTSSFKLTIIEKNDAPEISTITDQAIFEDTKLGPLNFSVYDIDSSNIVVKAESSNENLITNDSIIIQGTSIERSIIINPVINEYGSSIISISASDGFLTSTMQFTLTVKPVNDICEISEIEDQIIKEDSYIDSLNFIITDIDSSSLNVEARSSNHYMLLDQDIKIDNNNSNYSISLKPIFNSYGTSIITVNASDGELTQTKSFDLIVEPVNDPPFISKLKDQTILEDTISSPINFSIIDVDSPYLNIIASSSNESVISSSKIQLSGTGANRNIILVPQNNAFGNAVITLSVSDGELITNTSFNVLIEQVNDSPTISRINDIVIPSNSIIDKIDFSINDIETPSNMLNLSVKSSNIDLISEDDIQISGTTSNREMLINLKPEKTGNTTIILSVSDNEITKNTSFEIIVYGQQTDSDLDGYMDYNDDFPYDPKEWIDSDKDGIGDNSDTDDDNDLIDDSWEELYRDEKCLQDPGFAYKCMNPYDDLDGDGFLNIDEFNAGTRPDNKSPDKPEITSPLNGQTNLSITNTTLTASNYYDFEQDEHKSTKWQISEISFNSCLQSDPDCMDLTLVLDIESNNKLSSLIIPEFVLSYDTVYFVRLKYIDFFNQSSSWSDEYTFKTSSKITQIDNNNNGILDNQEIDEEMLKNQDINNDQIPDFDQIDNNFKCIKSFKSDTVFGVEGLTNVVNIETIRTYDSDEIEYSEDKPEIIPFGLLGYKLKLEFPGQEIKLKIFLSSPAPEGSLWYKYDKVNGWQDYSDYTEISNDRLSILITLIDGLVGDSDESKNAFIIDPGGLVILEQDDKPTINYPILKKDFSSDNCFISAACFNKHNIILFFLILTLLFIFILKSPYKL